jgi:hypothetical protein
VVVALLLVTVPILVAALAAFAHQVAGQRRALERLERRVAAVELDHAPTLVIEPDRETPPRPPNAMLN